MGGGFGAASWRRLLVALALAMFSGAAHASDYYCWAFEFDPGVKFRLDGTGYVQKSRYYYSDAFPYQPVDLPTLADGFKEYLNSGTTRLSAKSRLVAECKGASYDYDKFYWREKPLGGEHAPGDDQFQLRVNWAPSPALFEKAAQRIGSDRLKTPFLFQCFGAWAANGEDTYDMESAAIVRRSRVYEIPFDMRGQFNQQWQDHWRGLYRALTESRRSWDTQCREGATPRSMADWQAYYLDRYRSVTVIDDDFKPDFQVKSVAASSSPPPKMPALTIKDTTSAPKDWTPEQLAKAREAAAIKAKAFADAQRNEAESKVKIKEYFERMRKRGSAQ